MFWYTAQGNLKKMKKTHENNAAEKNMVYFKIMYHLSVRHAPKQILIENWS